MSNIYLFDVDGTLTPAKSKITPAFKKQFSRWMKGKEVYIVSGGTFIRIVDQLGLQIMNMVDGVFSCMGNVFYQRRDQINENGYSEWDVKLGPNQKEPKINARISIPRESIKRESIKRETIKRD